MVALRMTPARMQAIDARVDAVLQTTTFSTAVQRLRAELVDPVGSYGYERPLTSSLQSASDRQLMPELPGSEKLLVSEDKFVRPHIDAALQLKSPMSKDGSMHRARPDDKCTVHSTSCNFKR